MVYMRNVGELAWLLFYVPRNLQLMNNADHVGLFKGELVSRRAAEQIDGLPFIVGMVTLYKQFHSKNADQFFSYVAQYVKSLVQASQR